MTYEMALLDREIQGREEGHVEMVKNFLAAGTPIEFVIKATGWLDDKILKLKTDANANSND